MTVVITPPVVNTVVIQTSVAGGSGGGGGGGSSSGYPPLTVTTVSGNTTFNPAIHDVLLVDASGGSRTISLPAAAGAANAVGTVKKIDSSANTVTVDPSGAETIDGAATYVLTDQYESAEFVCNGTAWFLI